MSTRLLVAALALGALAAACAASTESPPGTSTTSSTTSTTPQGHCAIGSVSLCTTPDGLPGARPCLDGGVWGPECLPRDGGTGGAGGAGGSTGSTTTSSSSSTTSTSTSSTTSSAPECKLDEHCAHTPCEVPHCASGKCSVTSRATGDACDNGAGGRMCDATGACVAFIRVSCAQAVDAGGLGADACTGTVSNQGKTLISWWVNGQQFSCVSDATSFGYCPPGTPCKFNFGTGPDWYDGTCQ